MSLPPLTGVTVTALWTLHCRARAAAAGVLEDPEALRVEAAYEGALAARFGRPDRCFGERAAIYDRALRDFLARHPGAAVVSLGEGLETQRYRVEGYGRWTSVDLPEVIALRDDLLPAAPPHAHRSDAVGGTGWHAALGAGAAFVVAQGLMMYLAEETVRAIVEGLAERAGATAMMFDVVPRWTHRLSQLRPPMAGSLRMPRMRWGTDAAGLEARLRRWAPRASFEVVDVPMPSGPTPLSFRTVAARVQF